MTQTLPSWMDCDKAGVAILAVHAQPGAKRTQIVGEHDQKLKIQLASPPVDGKANQSLIDFLSDCLRIPKRQLMLVAGQTSRSKRVAIHGLTPEECVLRLKHD